MPSSASHTTALYTLSLHDALPICLRHRRAELPLEFPGRRSRRHDLVVAGHAGRLVLAHAVRDQVFLVAEVVVQHAVRELGVLRDLRSEEHTSELQSHHDLVCRLLLRTPPPSTLFPYTTLFRSVCAIAVLNSRLSSPADEADATISS